MIVFTPPAAAPLTVLEHLHLAGHDEVTVAAADGGGYELTYQNHCWEAYVEDVALTLPWSGGKATAIGALMRYNGLQCVDPTRPSYSQRPFHAPPDFSPQAAVKLSEDACFDCQTPVAGWPVEIQSVTPTGPRQVDVVYVSLCQEKVPAYPLVVDIAGTDGSPGKAFGLIVQQQGLDCDKQRHVYEETFTLDRPLPESGIAVLTPSL